MIKYNGIDTYVKVINGHYVSNILMLKDVFNAVSGVILTFHCSLLSNQGTFWGKCHPSSTENNSVLDVCNSKVNCMVMLYNPVNQMHEMLALTMLMLRGSVHVTMLTIFVVAMFYFQLSK